MIKRVVQISILACVMVFGMSSLANSQGGTDIGKLAENLEILKIVSLEIRPLFILTEQAFADLRNNKVPDQVLTNSKLQGLKNQEYDGRTSFSEALQEAIGKDDAEKYRLLFLRSAKQKPSARKNHYLDITLEITNKYDRDLRLANAEFEFFIYDAEAKPIVIDEKDKKPREMIPVGKSALDKDIDLESNPGNAKEKIKRLELAVALGSEQAVVFDTITHILNFVGKPAGRYFFIKGQFDLGIKSEKGWSYGETMGIRWMFCPTEEYTSELPLKACFQE